jgi:hypothetical protein
MATLDTAMLAEYARVDSAGLITMVAGGFVHVRSTEAGAMPIAVALRFWLPEGEPAVQFEIKIKPPDKSYDLAVSGSATPGEVSRPIDGLIGVSVAVRATVPLPAAGRYVVEVWLEDAKARELPFIVEFN